MVTIGRRSPVFARHGMVASSQPLATEVGMRILKQGGNAVDAAIAVAATLNLTEPCSTGIGGDCFLLYYDAKTKQVLGLNGSGRSPAALTREQALKDFAVDGDANAAPATFIPRSHGHAVTVPGTVAGWADAIDAWGSLPLADVLAPAIALAKEGFPVSTLTAASWKRGQFQLERGPYASELLIDGRAPLAGEIFKNPYLAACFEEIAAKGKTGFYEGRIAEAVVEMVQSKGGVMTLGDLKAHTSTFVTPIKTTFRGVDVYEIPPNGQGITALLALNILEQLLPQEEDTNLPAHNSAEYLHLLIEAMRLAFADAKWYVSDMEHMPDLPINELLSAEYAKQRAALINRQKATVNPQRGSPVLSCDTVSFQVVDGAGNAVSMVNSNYEGFGTGFIPRHTGFSLQNRGSNFCLNDPLHPNALAPRKRPYHTIIPAISTFHGTDELHSTFTVMGGFMQPQGHVQVLCNLLLHKLNAQEAIDGARFCIDAQREDNDKSYVFVEDDVTSEVVDALQTKFGHVVVVRSGLQRTLFGRGQIILRDPSTGVLSAGSDGRADGCAMGWSHLLSESRIAARRFTGCSHLLHIALVDWRNDDGAWQHSNSFSPNIIATRTCSCPTTTTTIARLQEYHERVHSVCQSTYQFPLQPPASRNKSPSNETDNAMKPSRRGYCRARVLETNKQFFHRRKPTPSSSFATPANAKDKVLAKPRDACVNFHQMTPRKDEFLFGSLRPPPRMRGHDGKHAASGGIAKDHFALGPGQYDVANIRPKTTACVKFSPSDRFHENFSTDQLGPGQYLTNDELTTRKAAVAVFSQTPRQTETALLVSPTASVVSSYYYRHTIATVRAEQSRQQHRQQEIDYVERNKAQVDQHRAVQRIRSARRRHLQKKNMTKGDNEDDLDDDAAANNELTLTAFKRRSSIFLDVSRQPIVPLSGLQEPSAKSALVCKASGNGVSNSTATVVTATKPIQESERLHQLVTLLRKIRAMEQRHVQQLVFTEWRRLDHVRSVAYAKHVIVKNSFCLRFRLRFRQKAAYVSILRRFLSGLSIDMQFAIAMEKTKRKIMVIQHWWRHVQLMVRVREEALYHKWINVETWLRFEYINQMPHLQRVFHPPSVLLMQAWRMEVDYLEAVVQLQLRKKWFTGRSVLTSDGCLRGYNSGNGGADSGVADAKELVVFRQCAFRFVLLTSSSPMPTEILSWKDKLERMGVTSGSASSGYVGGSISGPAAGSSGSILIANDAGNDQQSSSGSSGGSYSSVGDLVHMSMQSGILAPHSGSSTLLLPMTSEDSLNSFTMLTGIGGSTGLFSLSSGSSSHLAATIGSNNTSARSPTAPQPGKLQTRMRSMRNRTRMGMTVAEGELNYYVVDLLKDFPKVPIAPIWQTIREKLREKRKSFRAELYRYNLEMFHFHRHQEQIKHIDVLDKFKEFFITEQLKAAAPSNPRYLLDATKATAAPSSS
ncbi:Gamma-glutamyltransferase, partial [Globisporangium splendens]